MDGERSRTRHRSTPLLQELWAYAQHEQRKAASNSHLLTRPHPAPSPSLSSLHPLSPSLSPPSAGAFVLGDEDANFSESSALRSVFHRSFDAASLLADSSPFTTFAPRQIQHMSPPQLPLTASQLDALPTVSPTNSYLPSPPHRTSHPSHNHPPLTPHPHQPAAPPSSGARSTPPTSAKWTTCCSQPARRRERLTMC